MILVWLQTLLAIASLVLIILQQPADEGASRQSFFAPQVVRRGWEKISFIITLLVILAFLLVSFLRIIFEGN